MKYLRLFETKLIPKYKVGDYVHINIKSEYDNCLAKIIQVDMNGFLTEPGTDRDYNVGFDFYIDNFNPFPYSVNFYNIGYSIEEKLIDRYLTDDEIKYYNYLKDNYKDIKKFNI